MLVAMRLALGAVVAAVLLCPSAGSAQEPVVPGPGIRGLVVDMSGGIVQGATIELIGAPAMLAVESDAAGRFVIEAVLPTHGTRGMSLRVSAAGFAVADVTLADATPGELLRIVLAPAALDESVTVTASRGADPLAGAPTTAVVTGAELVASGAGAIDDALRQTPGFSLFRRSTSRVANPTTQGVTLRGVSGSGASRSSVLADGLGLNDPFGSWVYWNRVPLVSIDRIEVMRGAGGDLYGAEALGGVVQIVTLDASGGARARLLAEYGGQATSRLSGFAAARLRGWSASATGEWYDTNGVFVVAEADRGAVDTRAASTYLTSGVAIARQGRAWQVAARIRASDEQRANGTPLQVNDTNWRQWSGEVSGHVAGGQWSTRAAAGTQGYYQTFSAILAARAAERLTSEQRIPTRFALGQAQWARAWTHAAILAGADAHRTSATQTERRYGVSGALIDEARSGGTERAVGAFMRGSFTPASSVTVAAGVRLDRVQTTPVVSSQPEQASTIVNPRVNAAWRLSDAWSVHGAAYRSSRTPTLNERYRAFRVGNILTNANPSLDPERLTGVEAGARWRVQALTTRATVYWNTLEDAVTNVTISSTPTQVTRQRQNTDTLRSAGAELEAEWRPVAWLRVTAAGVAGRARVHSAPAQPQLEGKTVPQSLRYELAGGATLVSEALGTMTLQARRQGAQFDDDLNTLVLAPFTVVDAALSRHVIGGLSVSLAVENLFDAEYDVARTPTRSIGWPRTVRVAVRWFGW